MKRCDQPRGDAQSFSEWLGPEFRLLDRYELQDSLVETLKRTSKFSHLAARVAECHRSFRRKVCEHRHEWAEAQQSCNVRLCPHDQRRRSLRLASRWERHLLGRVGLRYIVFAESNSADLSQGIASLYRAWALLRKSALWKRSAKGSIAVLEVTYNAKDATWHPHLNVLFEGDYIPFEALNQAWIEATHGHGQTSFITAADGGTIRELLKYVTKLSDFVDQPRAVELFLAAVARKRFVRTYGTFYNLPVDEEETTGHCPDCGSDCIADLGVAHAFQIVIDYNGVLRVDRKRMTRTQHDPLSEYNVNWPRAPVDRALQDKAWIEMTRKFEEGRNIDASL